MLFVAIVALVTEREAHPYINPFLSAFAYVLTWQMVVRLGGGGSGGAHGHAAHLLSLLHLPSPSHTHSQMFVLYLLLLDAQFTDDKQAIVLSSVLMVANLATMLIVFVATQQISKKLERKQRERATTLEARRTLEMKSMRASGFYQGNPMHQTGAAGRDTDTAVADGGFCQPKVDI